MRELIRPTLFLVARLGFFLSVMAWVAGQWWSAKYNSPAYQFAILDYGFTVGKWTYPLPVDQIVEVDRPDWLADYWPGRRKVRLGQREWRSVIPGVVRAGGGGTMREVNSFFVGVRHWLIVTIFALFNGVLMWVYRKRGKELARDE